MFGKKQATTNWENNEFADGVSLLFLSAAPFVVVCRLKHDLDRMNKYFQPFALTQWTKRLSALLAVLLVLFLPISAVQAHTGGAIIDSGYTDQYEWLVTINPYPTPVGPALMTFLIYSKETHKAVLDLQAEVSITQVIPSTPCCKTGEILGPFHLTTDPVQFPGDYSAAVTLDKTGPWEAKFLVTDKSGTFDIVVPFYVMEDSGTQATLDAVMAQVAAGQIPVTPQPQSPLAMTQNSQPSSPLNGQPSSPLTMSNPVSLTTSVTNSNVLGGQSAMLSASQPNPFGRFGWLWGLLAMLPIAGIFIWGLRPL